MGKDQIKTRSQAPGPLEDPAQESAAGTVNPSPEVTARTRVEKARALLARFGVPVGDNVRAYLLAQLADSVALRLGGDANPEEVFDDLVAALVAFAAAIQAGKLPGYGPKRARFAAECTLAVAPVIEAHAMLDETVQVASKKATRTLDLTAPVRRDALRAVESLLAHDPDALDHLRARTASDGTVDRDVNALHNLADEVRALQKNVPAALLEDAGLTRPLLDALVDSSSKAARARNHHEAGRVERQAQRAELAVPVGRMVFELRQLLASARTARKSNARIPRFTSKFVGRGAAKKGAAEETPEAPLTPPAPDNG